MESLLEIDPLTEFFDSIKSKLTRDSYTKKLGLFFRFLKLDGDLKTQAREFTDRAKKAELGIPWATQAINEHMRFQKLRVEKKEIVESTLPNFVKPIRLFCEQNDIVLNWKKINRRIPRGRSSADDRIPTIEEIKKLLTYPDRRVKIAALIMLSSGGRVGAFDFLNWGHIEKIEKNGKLLCAKIRIYAGQKEEYFSFITPEAYCEIEAYINFRKSQGEKITKDSPVLRDLFLPEKLGRGIASRPKRYGYNLIRNQMYAALFAVGIRKKLDEGKKRHEFSADHSFRKFFTTICLKHTSSLNVEILRGDDTGLMESYNRPSEEYLLGEYLKCVPELSILQTQALPISSEDVEFLKTKLVEIEDERRKDKDRMDELQKKQKESDERQAVSDQLLRETLAALNNIKKIEGKKSD